jgi:hypothetical protein
MFTTYQISDMGLRIALYSRTLFSSDSCDRFPRSQLICLAFSVNCCRFFMSVFHVSFRSRRSPRYEHFTSVLIGMIELLIVTCGQLIRRVVKLICTDFSVLIFMRHFWNHICRRFMCFWRSAEDIRGFGFAERTAVSLANVARTVFDKI